MTLRLMLGGLKSLILPALHSGYQASSHPVSGAYCYSVWLRHQALIEKAVPGHRPRTVVEIGPGESLGVGYAALMSGADRYIALDAVERLVPQRDLAVLDEIASLFERRAAIPNEKQFPNLLPALRSYAFPKKLFADDGPRPIRVDHDRVESIRSELYARPSVLYDDRPFSYLAPWTERTVDRGSVDLVLTQAALQDIAHGSRHSQLADTFAAMAKWLKPGGVLSHQIDFSLPGGDTWNHHWAHSDATWMMMRANRPLFANREPLSTYLALCEENGCEVVSLKRVEQEGLTRERMAARFRDLPERDVRTSSAHLIAVKR